MLRGNLHLCPSDDAAGPIAAEQRQFSHRKPNLVLGSVRSSPHLLRGYALQRHSLCRSQVFGLSQRTRIRSTTNHGVFPHRVGVHPFGDATGADFVTSVTTIEHRFKMRTDD